MRPGWATVIALGVSGLCIAFLWLNIRFDEARYALICRGGVTTQVTVNDILRQMRAEQSNFAGGPEIGPLILIVGFCGVWMATVPACCAPFYSQRRWHLTAAWLPPVLAAILYLALLHGAVACDPYRQTGVLFMYGLLGALIFGYGIVSAVLILAHRWITRTRIKTP